ncbi:hypothetical protein SAMN05421805_11450 [Saccharopolyspora antimicrobica]|uniref:Uncharacterized protein n=1 Tax=Saccharopolyspora antimicrobica TaxID=455193 RepID=A0A1I5H012_9PSEU|nr:hypothetical protein [Saccharopolyspora antimicrobica]RKT90049.1 hypothetical protein ATL45_0016 [Saccharopolyspora antimicrobica]SFO41549.1 hypothetical protein SAMN05421805_11450 [Saccharopolyspora antimicrobica]
MTLLEHIANHEQYQTWNGQDGRHWADHHRRYDAMAGGFAERLLDAASISVRGRAVTGIEVPSVVGRNSAEAADFLLAGQLGSVTRNAARTPSTTRGRRSSRFSSPARARASCSFPLAVGQSQRGHPRERQSTPDALVTPVRSSKA